MGRARGHPPLSRKGPPFGRESRACGPSAFGGPMGTAQQSPSSTEYPSLVRCSAPHPFDSAARCLRAPHKSGWHRDERGWWDSEGAERRGPPRIYVASSWRNEERQQNAVRALRDVGYEVYDFRHPAPGNDGFSWSAVDAAWTSWSPARFRERLDHPIAQAGFALDMHALSECDACVLVLPCGRSAHLEAGWAAGAGKVTLALLAPGEPELMLKMVDALCLSHEEVLETLSSRGLGCPAAASGAKGGVA
jgi:hypothetical protein